MTDTSWPVTWCISPLVTSYFHVYVLPCNCLFHSYTCTIPVICLLLSRIPCLADPSWSLNSGFLLCYHLPCHYFRPVSSCFHLTHVYHLISDVLSSDHLTCYYLARPLLYYDLPGLLSISCHVWLLVKYHHPVMLSLNTQHDILDFVIIMFTGILSCYSEWN